MIESHELRILFLIGMAVVSIVAVPAGLAIGSLVRWIFPGDRGRAYMRPVSLAAWPAGGEGTPPGREREAA